MNNKWNCYEIRYRIWLDNRKFHHDFTRCVILTQETYKHKEEMLSERTGFDSENIEILRCERLEPNKVSLTDLKLEDIVKLIEIIK